MAIKRIVALDGDTVVTRAPYPFPEMKVPSGHVWVEGEHPDYQRNTLDSNTYGPVSCSTVFFLAAPAVCIVDVSRSRRT